MSKHLGQLVKRWMRIEKIDMLATGKSCRQARTMNGLTLRETARRMNVSASFLSDLELGRRNWTEKHIENFNRAMAD